MDTKETSLLQDIQNLGQAAKSLEERLAEHESLDQRLAKLLGKYQKNQKSQEPPSSFSKEPQESPQDTQDTAPQKPSSSIESPSIEDGVNEFMRVLADDPSDKVAFIRNSLKSIQTTLTLLDAYGAAFPGSGLTERGLVGDLAHNFAKGLVLLGFVASPEAASELSDALADAFAFEQDEECPCGCEARAAIFSVAQ